MSVADSRFATVRVAALSKGLGHDGLGLPGGRSHSHIIAPEIPPPPERVTTDSPERALWRAILDDALRRLTNTSPRRSDSDRRMFRDRAAEAEQERAWLFSDDWTHPVSFLNLCGNLGLDPEAIRALVKSGVQQRRARSDTRDRRAYMQARRRREKALAIHTLTHRREAEK